MKHRAFVFMMTLGMAAMMWSPLMAEESAGPGHKLNYDYLAAGYGISLGLLFGYLIWLSLKGKRLRRAREELKARGFQLDDEL